MELKEFQEKANEIIEKIDEKVKCEHNANNTFLHLMEEIGELANELNKPSIRNEEIDKNNLSEEFADVFLLLTKLATLNEIEIENSIKNKFEALKKKHNL
jgi:NTP pyrophosphatase (non-canonical NTP hydrolase)